jgi:hypothetical protein
MADLTTSLIWEAVLSSSVPASGVASITGTFLLGGVLNVNGSLSARFPRRPLINEAIVPCPGNDGIMSGFYCWFNELSIGHRWRIRF